MTKLKESKQEQDSKSSYQKAQERTLTRKLALARKRARETAKKQQAELQKVFEEDKLLPNKEVPNQGMMGSSQGHAMASALQIQVIRNPPPTNHSFPPEAFDESIGDPSEELREQLKNAPPDTNSFIVRQEFTLPRRTD